MRIRASVARCAGVCLCVQVRWLWTLSCCLVVLFHFFLFLFLAVVWLAVVWLATTTTAVWELPEFYQIDNDFFRPQEKKQLQNAYRNFLINTKSRSFEKIGFIFFYNE